ncbi:MAG TPA: TIGR02302 family protein [Stellaceae bacterium]|nr:TIGR02302 family protein [Stellaceae bacterium]
MSDGAKTQQAVESPALGGRLRLAGAALLWERLWPSLWPATGILGAFLALALFDLPARLPGALHAALLVLVAAALVAALVPAIRGFRLPDRSAERRRVEQASGLTHRPLTALEDRLSGGGDDPAAQALWQAHRARMAAQLRSLRVGLPAAGLVRRDPFGLRAALALVLLIAAVDAGPDWSQRLLRSLSPSFEPWSGGAQASLDIWVTPPEYTGLPPQFLPATAPDQPIAVPTGSTVLAQVHGGGSPPQLEIDGKAKAFSRIDAENFKGAAALAAGSKLAVEQDGRTLGAWPITIIPDLPPKIDFAKPPQHTDRAVLRLEYVATDDYGVESARAVITRPGDKSPPIILDLPLPGEHLRDVHDTSFNDLTAHPWAGLPVDIHLEAKDALGQTGESDTLRITLPERAFHNPVARAIIDQRKQLTLDPTQREVVAETLSDLSLRPAMFNDDKVVFLALRTAQARLVLDKDAQAVPAVQQLLWDTAVRIEDGRTTLVQRDLRDAMKALQDALARNAPDAEIEKLMQQLQQAINRYLQALAQNAQQQDQQNQAPIDPSRLLSQQDLQRMLDRARELARTGSRDAARDLLSQLQDMLENLRMARPGQMGNGASQAMQEMQQMMERQQQLLDKSFRSRGQSGQMGRSGQMGQDNMAGDQEALRRELGEMMRRLGEQSGDLPQSLGRAERAMRGATSALQQGQPGDAIGPQTEALDQLQQAARSLAQQLLGEMSNGAPGNDSGDRDGMRETDRDPFGRLNPQDDANGGIDEGGRMRMGGPTSNYAVEKAKTILDELRRRAGERDRPEIEHDYIDRLLKQF